MNKEKWKWEIQDQDEFLARKDAEEGRDYALWYCNHYITKNYIIPKGQEHEYKSRKVSEKL